MERASAATEGVFVLFTGVPTPEKAELEQILKTVERDTGMCFAGNVIVPCHGSGDLSEEYGRFLVETFERDGRLPRRSVDRALIRDVTINGARRIVVVVLTDEFHPWVRELIPEHLAGAEQFVRELAGGSRFAQLGSNSALSFVASAWDGDIWRTDHLEIMVSLFAETEPGRIRELMPGGDYVGWVTPWVNKVRERGADAAHWLVCADGSVGVVHLGYFGADDSVMFLPKDLLSPADQRKLTGTASRPAGGRPGDRIGAPRRQSGDAETEDNAAGLSRAYQDGAPRESQSPPSAPEAPVQASDGRPVTGRASHSGAGDAKSQVWQVGDVISDLYDVRAVISTGGMGLVYRVWHRVWQVELAVKTPRQELLDSSAHVRGFEEEAEAWVALGAHPHTVTCAYVRQLGGIPRVFAEWVDGGSLAEAIQDSSLYNGDERCVLSRLLDVAIQFAWGLEHAHSKGLVHQDVKPANVMLTREGTVKVTDFGLAKAYGGAVHVAPGATVRVGYGGAMTKEYCSPEQAQAVVDPTVRLSRATDVWSWAISVWELFVGERPCLYGQTAPVVLESFLRGGRPAAGISPLPLKVASLLSSCFATNPAARPKMGVLASELIGLYAELTGNGYPRPRPDATALLADGLSNHALSLLDVGRPERAEQLWQQARAADPGNLYAAYNYGLRRWRRGRITDVELIAELTQVHRTHPHDPVADHMLGSVHLERGDVGAARRHLELAVVGAPDDREVAAALVLARGQLDEVEPAVFHGHHGVIRGVAISADGRVAASGSVDRTVRVWNPEARRCQHILTTDRAVDAMALSADGTRVIAHDVGASLWVWDAETGHPLHHLDQVSATSLAISPDGSVAVLGGVGSVRICDLDRGRMMRTLREEHRYPDNAAGSVAFTADARLALGFYPDSDEIRIWEVSSGRLLHVLDNLSGVGLDSDIRQAISAHAAAQIPSGGTKTWMINSGGRCLRTLNGLSEPITSVARSADGRLLVFGSQDRAVRVYHVPSAGPRAPWRLARASPAR